MMGIASHDPITEQRRVQWRAYREKFLRGEAGDWPKLKALMKEHPEFMHGTVGAVAVDEKGEVTAGTSTGGVGFAQNTPQMAHAYFKKGMSEPVSGL
jgi:isoaspartyl peptidase/L-asparaginase-like protein (Ntn-hydrolase superfamily)